MRRLVQMDAALVQDLPRRRFSRPSQNGLHTGDQDLGAEGLGNVFIHAQLKALQLVLLIPSGSEHDDRYPGIAPDLPAHLPAVHLRHHHIQDHQRDIALREKNIQRLASVARLQDLIIVLLKEVPHQLAHSAFIIYDQYFYPFHTLPPPPRKFPFSVFLHYISYL